MKVSTLRRIGLGLWSHMGAPSSQAHPIRAQAGSFNDDCRVQSILSAAR
jgi:hypothetical protein